MPLVRVYILHSPKVVQTGIAKPFCSELRNVLTENAKNGDFIHQISEKIAYVCAYVLKGAEIYPMLSSNHFRYSLLPSSILSIIISGTP